MPSRTRANFPNAKNYAMRRMTLALGRAITAGTSSARIRAGRWARAWGLVAGIFGKGIRLKSSDVLMRGNSDDSRRTRR
ncbi:MAG: hypothetical protein V4724_12125 [Pseudomonadota bacterium]